MKGATNYTAKDIERYHSGQLTAAEMHALEKAALDDPFLADALEGYGFTQTPSADLSALQQRLQGRIGNEQKRRGLFVVGNNWLKIAALFVLVAGGGWLVVQLFNNGPATELATGSKTQHAPAIVPLENTADSTTVSTDAPLATRPTARATEKRVDQSSPRETEAMARRAPAATELQIPPSAFGRAAGDSLKDEVYAARERSIMDEPRQATVLKKAEIAASEKKQSEAPARATDTIRNFNVTLQRDTTGLSEVVVVGYGNRKRMMNPQARTVKMTVDTLEPSGGWTRFDDYIAANLKEPSELKTKGLTGGEVELSFEVNKDGEPVNISVTKPLCEKCDEEAIRLLKEGPKWKKGKKKGKIKIKFPLTP